MSTSLWLAIGFRGRYSIHIHNLRILNSFDMCKYRSWDITFFDTCQHKLNHPSSCFRLFPHLAFVNIYLERTSPLYELIVFEYLVLIGKSTTFISRTMIMIFMVMWFHEIDVIGWLGREVNWLVIVWSVENLDVPFILVSNRVSRSLVNSHSHTSHP